jgi:hypothetical protein
MEKSDEDEQERLHQPYSMNGRDLLFSLYHLYRYRSNILFSSKNSKRFNGISNASIYTNKNIFVMKILKKISRFAFNINNRQKLTSLFVQLG